MAVQEERSSDSIEWKSRLYGVEVVNSINGSKDQKVIDMSKFHHNDLSDPTDVNRTGGWNRCRGIIAGLSGHLIWLLVPLSIYVFAMLPFDTFVPSERSIRRPVAVTVSKQEREAIRNETERLVESLATRQHPNPDKYEGTLKVRSVPEEIAEIESYVGTRLPEDIRCFLERFDGLETGTSFRSVRWLSRVTMLENSRETAAIHSDYVEAPLLLPGAWYHPAIIVFDDNGGGGLGVDAFTGIIYEWDHDGGKLKQVAPSFLALLRGLDAQMERGEEPYWRNLEIR